ncbi:hypothetical protein CHUAL_009549 [Chamberlinius hualienensis]
MAQFNQVQAVQLHEIMSSLLDSKLDCKFKEILANNGELLSKVGFLEKIMLELKSGITGVKQVEGHIKLWSMINCLGLLGGIIKFQANGILKAHKLREYNGVKLKGDDDYVKMNDFSQFSLRSDLLCDGFKTNLILDNFFCSPAALLFDSIITYIFNIMQSSLNGLIGAIKLTTGSSEDKNVLLFSSVISKNRYGIGIRLVFLENKTAISPDLGPVTRYSRAVLAGYARHNNLSSGLAVK